ncbi:response regulator [Thalassobaculum sp. OXR-137]|uniref:response regulator n=1 Tax=Thalassobaculum sp. OXR-137 TaxID=3100173 RepID=UPI002AC8CA88|nr:response regulator [Thalassobaculum sp. OXR-137]WPZ35874.1 response regulator [Thalassobaculum sp. OXR-137]
MSGYILIIDDDVDFAEFVEEGVTLAGYTPLVATSAEQALTFITSKQIHGVITDIVMPDMDGIEFLQEIAARNANIPVVLMSGFQADYLRIAESIGRGRGLHVVGILVKPASLDAVISKTRALAEARPAQC